MVDTRIRRNERCVIGLPACDYVFSSTRNCFIAYGFSTSVFERDILIKLLEERGIVAVEAGGQIEPGKLVFCAKICSKIIVAQFCIVLINSDRVKGRNVANANVNMEYGLMLGHNKYVIPFQREADVLPFNVAGIDTIKYNQGNFSKLAIQAIDQALAETSQTAPTQSIDQLTSLFVLTQKATFVDIVNNPQERAIFDLGNTFGFKLLVKFDGLSYVFLGIFAAIQARPIMWRLSQFLELLGGRINSFQTRRELGLANNLEASAMELFVKRLEIWLIVNGDSECNDIRGWIDTIPTPLPLKIFTIADVTKSLSELPA